VYVDPNNAGHYVQGDPAANNVKVTLTGLTLTQQQVTQTATTGQDGSYQFTGLQPGIYSLTDQPIPSQYTAGTDTLGSLGGVVNNGQMILALPQGGDGTNYDFGLVLPATTSPPPSPSASPIPSPPPVSPPPPPSTNSTPATTPPPATTADPPPVLSKRSLLGDGWQSLG
jgi:hypothetical protein